MQTGSRLSTLVCALVFVLLCAPNSVALVMPAITPSFAMVKAPLVEASTCTLAEQEAPKPAVVMFFTSTFRG